MKQLLSFLIIASMVTMLACNNNTDTGKTPTEQQSMKDGHNHTDTTKKSADSLGMRMGGNELDSKKK